VSSYPVLLFHSVDNRELLSLKNLGNIRPELFEKLIVRLNKEFDIVSLKQLVQIISGEEKSRDRLLSLTFDDGPKSYVRQAVPVLEAYKLPSACFLITGSVDDKAIYWRYLYNFCIHKGFSRELAGFINQQYKANILPDDIISFSRNNYDRKKNLRILGKIFEELISEKEYREKEKDLFLSFEDVGTLRNNPLVSFGVHTSSHPVMRCLSELEIREEIASSLDFFRIRIGDEVPMFSIPFGRLFMDYDERTISIAKKLSVQTILSAYGGGNANGQPLYNIRRISVSERNLAGGIEAFIKSLWGPEFAGEYLQKEKRLTELLSGKMGIIL
jgi:peptidoglycan/xylan/chitin deacetylase (PgdA/CDA1 family)